MAILYNVKVNLIELETKSIELDIQPVHPDAIYFSDNIGFAIRLLGDSAPNNSQLAQIIDNDRLRNGEWLKNNAKGIIANCELLAVRAKEPVSLKNNGKYAYWHGEEKHASAVLKIIVTDKSWIEHLTPQSTWGSTAYDTEVDYQACEPISPISESYSSDRINSGGWKPIESNNLDNYSASWPTIIYLPKYSQKSYRRANKISSKDLTRDQMEGMLFKTVFILDRMGYKSFGIMIPDNDRFGILNLTSTGKSCYFFDFDKLLTIGLAEFNTNDALKAEV